MATRKRRRRRRRKTRIYRIYAACGRVISFI